MPRRRWFPNTTDNEPPDRMTPDRPELIEEVNNLNPYRGTEDHGVPNKVETHWPDYTGHDAYLDNNQDIVYEPEKPGIDPVPVVIVSQGQRELRRWYTSLAMARADTQLILGRNEARQTARIKNIGLAAVLLGPENAVGNGVGYPLAPGEEFTTNSEAEVWGVINLTSTFQGGWVQLVPRQTINGVQTINGPTIDTRGYTALRAVHRIYAISGTTKSAQAFISMTDQAGNIVSGSALGTGSVLNVVTSIPITVSPLNSPAVIGQIYTGAASGDQVLDSELWGYFTPDYSGAGLGSAANISLLRIYQEITVKE